ncbi:MAG: OmpA family protein [Polyangiales bacterium]
MKRQLNPSLTALLCLTLLAVFVTGCKDDEEVVVEDTTGSEIPEPEPEVEVMPMAEPCSFETVYFEFNASDLDSSSRSAIQEAVECYRGSPDPNLNLLLTGAADPRGTEEYNLALGERRGQAVRSYLISLGLDGNRISVTSVGEEMATGTNEAGWARDRHVTGSAN